MPRNPKKQVPVETGLERAYPSSPSIPPKYCLHLRFPHNAPTGKGRKMTMTFVGTYAAKKFIDEVIGNDNIKWPNLHTIVTKSGVMIYCTPPSSSLYENDLEVVFNHEYSPQEAMWNLGDRERQLIKVFTRPYSSDEKDLRAKVESVKPVSGNLVTIAELCEELGIKARDGRSLLRKSEFIKPPHGWSFEKGSQELNNIRKFLESGK